jgi:hypothetical protein
MRPDNAARSACPRPIFAPQAAGDEGKIVWGDDLKKTSK